MTRRTCTARVKLTDIAILAQQNLGKQFGESPLANPLRANQHVGVAEPTAFDRLSKDANHIVVTF
jgi:hypothetical protein